MFYDVDCIQWDSTTKEDYKKIPRESGIYMLLDLNKTVLYVGQSIRLRERVLQHVRSKEKEYSKDIVSIEFVTQKWLRKNGLQFLSYVESDLIKKLNPQFNIKYKSDTKVAKRIAESEERNRLNSLKICRR